MKKLFSAYILISLLLVFTNLQVTAQRDSTRLRQEVEVVKAYQPSVSDAFKINDIPKVKDEKREKPSFEYQINSQPVFSTFDLEPVQAAQMVGEPKAELGKGLLKAGVGNYKTPYAELFFNTTATKKSNFGMHFKHLSSNGSVKLVNDDKVDAPYSENVAELFTNHFFGKSTLNTKLFFSRDAHNYYGYAGENLDREDKERLFPFWDQKQAFSKGGLQLRLANDDESRATLNYDLGLNYQYFGSKTGQTENSVKIETGFKQDFESFKGILGLSLGYLKTDSIRKEINGSFGDKQQILIKAAPAILLEGDIARLQVGLNSFLLFDDDADARMLITPNIMASFSPVENVMTLFAGANGLLKQNHYSAIAAENRFVNPYQDIRNTEYQYILTAGLKGKFTANLNYRFYLDYAGIKDEHFYVFRETESQATSETAYLLTRSNTFDVLYDDLKQTTMGAEFYYTASDLVNFHLRGKYFSYNMDSLEYAWHKPDFELTLSTILNPEGPLKFNADIFFMGERKALSLREVYNPLINSTGPVQVDQTSFNLSSYIDLNFGMEYQFSPKLSFWGRANNFAFQKYENWLGYAQQGFNLMVGASFSF